MSPARLGEHFSATSMRKRLSGGCRGEAEKLELLGHFAGLWGQSDGAFEIRTVSEQLVLEGPEHLVVVNREPYHLQS